MPNLEVSFENTVVATYRRLSYKHWYALAEFVDNSTQAYINHKDILDSVFSETDSRLYVKIKFDEAQDLLTISDNSIGMSYDDLKDALTIGKPPLNNTGRSKFGLGLKTAACWFGDYWTIETKKLGEEIGHKMVFDVERISSGNKDLQYEEISGYSADDHFTTIEISQLNRDFKGRTVWKIKDYLRQMYRKDINDYLDLFWQDEKLQYDYDEELYSKLLDNYEGRSCKQDIKIELDDLTITGWAGVLASGSRSKAGFSIFQNNRIIKTWPDPYKPENIFGPDGGRNDLINQRLVGELHMDGFDVSHTKDEILFSDDQQDRFEHKLKENIVFLIKAAREYSKIAADQRTSSLPDAQQAADEINKEINSPEFLDIVNEELPDEELLEIGRQLTIKETVTRSEPYFTAELESVTVKLFLNGDMSHNDPYVTINYSTIEDNVIVIVNLKHPHWNELKNYEAILSYLKHNIYDGVSEWKCEKKASEIRPNTIKKIKDQLLRLPFEIEGLE